MSSRIDLQKEEDWPSLAHYRPSTRKLRPRRMPERWFVRPLTPVGTATKKRVRKKALDIVGLELRVSLEKYIDRVQYFSY